MALFLGPFLGEEIRCFVFFYGGEEGRGGEFGVQGVVFKIWALYAAGSIELKEGIFIPGPQGTTIQPLSGATLLRSHMFGVTLCRRAG